MGRNDRKGGRRPIRVALVTSAGLVPGGAERQMLLLAEGLPKSEFRVDFICLKTAGEDADRARAAGARVRVIGLKGRRESGWPLPVYLGDLAWTIGRYITTMAGRYDIVDAWLYHAYAIASMTRPFTRPRALIAGRRSLSDFKADFNILERAADRIARLGTDRIIANSEAVKADVVRREGVDPDRIRVIRNAVDAAPPMLADERERIRASWGVSAKTLVVGCVANYKPHKGLELLLSAGARMRELRPGLDLRLVLVGEGRLRPTLERIRTDLGIEDMVVLHGVEPDARSIYGAFDIAVQASEAEGLPNVVLEAGAAGLPVIATSAGGTVEILTDGATGILIPVGDQDALIASLVRLCDRPDERRKLGEAAQRDILDRFGVDRMVDARAALYRELAWAGQAGSGGR